MELALGSAPSRACSSDLDTSENYALGGPWQAATNVTSTVYVKLCEHRPASHMLQGLPQLKPLHI